MARKAKEKTCFGFGGEPSETQNHFYVVLFGRDEQKSFVVTDVPDNAGKDNQLKLQISKKKWNAVVKDLTAEFNARLRAEKKPVGKFSTGGTPVERMFGKEMMVLLWAIQDCDPSCIDKALTNWKGLQPEERWWLYTMTNASTGGINDNNTGWRVALRYALCENPVIERVKVEVIK